MGGACLRDHGHPWPDRGARRVAAERRQQGGVAHQPDASRAHARSDVLRAGGHADAVWIRVAYGESDAVPDPHSHADALTLALDLGVGKPVGDRDHQRLADAVPIASRYADAITVDQRQPNRQTLGLALARLVPRRGRLRQRPGMTAPADPVTSSWPHALPP
jgi:hypothetical protein